MAGKQKAADGAVAVIDNEVEGSAIDASADVIDGTVYEAKIAEQAAVIESLNAQVAQLKVQMYDTLTAGGSSDSNDENLTADDDSDEDDDIEGIDDLFGEDE